MTTRLVRSLGVGRHLDWSSIQGVQLVAFWCFGIIGCLSWLTWKKGNTQFRAISRTVRIGLCGCILVCMVQCAEGKERTFGKSLEQ
ncbi:unnamed protein product, partial [Vitis vinifera]